MVIIVMVYCLAVMMLLMLLVMLVVISVVVCGGDVVCGDNDIFFGDREYYKINRWDQSLILRVTIV